MFFYKQYGILYKTMAGMLQCMQLNIAHIHQVAASAVL